VLGEMEGDGPVGKFDALETGQRLASQFQSVGEASEQSVEVLEARDRAGGKACALLYVDQFLRRRLEHFAGVSVTQLGAAMSAEDEEERPGEQGSGAGESGQQPGRGAGVLVDIDGLFLRREVGGYFEVDGRGSGCG